MVQKPHVEGCSPEGSESTLLDAGFEVVHVTVPASQCEIYFNNEHSLNKSCMVLAIACVMPPLNVIK